MALKSGSVTFYGTGMRNLSRQLRPPENHAIITRKINRRIDIKEHRALLRNQLIDRVEVLSKVKSLFLIPGIEMMTTQMVADFYGVNTYTLNTVYIRNKTEIDTDGVLKKSLAEFKDFCLVQNEQVEGFCKTMTGDRKGHTKFIFGNEEVEFPHSGSKFFSPRAVLRIGMLLRDSEVAKEVRTQLHT